MCESHWSSASTFDLANFSNCCGLFSPIISAYVLNQCHGHWLISDVLHFAISTSLKLKEENQIASFENVMDDDSIVIDELSLLTSNTRR